MQLHFRESINRMDFSTTFKRTTAPMPESVFNNPQFVKTSGRKLLNKRFQDGRSLGARSLAVVGLALSLILVPAHACEAQNPADGIAADTATENSGQNTPANREPETPPQSSLMTLLFGGGPLGIGIVSAILVLSVVSLYSIFDHALTITRRRIMPQSVLDELERLIAHGELRRATEFCQDPENYSLATEVILAGLNRYQTSEFGFAEYRAAVEEAGEDQTGKLYRRTEVLNVIGAIAPMLGLTGTVLGMIQAFNTIAAREGMAQPQELAGGIGQALITTLLGLLVAIPTMIALSYYRNKIDSLIAETGKRVERILAPLGRKKNKTP